MSYIPTGNPATGAKGLSATVRAEFVLIGNAFANLPAFLTTSVYTTTFNQQGNYTFTLPSTSGTLAMLSDVASSVAAEAARAGTAETANAAAITAEAAARTAAVAAEATRAGAAEALLAPLAAPALTGAATLQGSPIQTTATLASPPAIGGATPAAGAFTTISATGAITQGGQQVVYNSGTWAINISGTAASANYVDWSNVGTKPYIPNQNVNSGASPTFGNLIITGYISVSGASGSLSLAGAGMYITPSGISGPNAGWGPTGVGVNSNNGMVAAAFFTNSDARLKSDIRDLPEDTAIEWVMTARPRTYTMGSGKPCAGFVAQEDLQSQLRSATVLHIKDDREMFAESDGFAEAGSRLARDYEMDIPYLTAALQVALRRIAALEAKCQAL